MDINVLKNFIKGERDNYISVGGKFNKKAEAMQEVLIKMNQLDNTVVTSEDLVCEGLED